MPMIPIAGELWLAFRYQFIGVGPYLQKHDPGMRNDEHLGLG